MTDTERTLLPLLAACLWDAASAIPDEVDWKAVVAEARKQSVLGLITPALPAEMEDLGFVQHSLFLAYMHAQDELTALLQAGGIPFVILKGAAAAVYYPRPALRTFGDIDILVSEENYPRTRELLAANGYAEEPRPDTSRHCAFQKDGMTCELHHRFSTRDFDIESYVTEGLSAPEYKKTEGHCFPMLPPLANGLVLLAHLRIHLKSGLGPRQVIDWMMYCHKVLDDTLWQTQFAPAAEALGVTTLAVTVTAMCQRHLGLTKSITWCRDADPALCDELMESVISSGNFGKKRGRGNSVETVIAAIKSHGLFRRLQYAGEFNWGLYHRHHWLKPLCWLYQIFRYIRQGLSRKTRLSDDAKRGLARYELLKRLGVE